MPVIAGVAGKDRRRTLPFPPMWERDGQAPQRQEHGPQRQGWPDAWGLGNLGIWVSRARPCQPACWIWYCTRPATWYREYLRLLQSDCLCTAVCTLFACARSVPPHQSRPALGADSQHMAALHKVVIDHSLPPLLNRSIIKLIMHAFAWRQRRSQPAPLELKVLSMGGGPKRCLLTVRTRRDGSNHPTLNHSTTLSFTHSLTPSIHHHSTDRSLDLSLALALVLLHVSPTTHTSGLCFNSEMRPRRGPFAHNRESIVDTRPFASSLLDPARPCFDLLVCPSLGACIVAVYTSM